MAIQRHAQQKGLVEQVARSATLGMIALAAVGIGVSVLRDALVPARARTSRIALEYEGSSPVAPAMASALSQVRQY